MATDFAALTESLGWLLALMFAALLPAWPNLRQRDHGGWLVAFCATRLGVAAHALVVSAWSSETRELAAIVSGMLLWEFARRVWNDRHARRISAATHVIALECFALVFAANAAAGWTATLGWLLPVTLLVATLPILLGGAAVLLLWRCVDQRTVRLAVVGLAMYGLGAAAWPVSLAGLAAPWMVTAGFAGIWVAVPAFRSRIAFTWLAGLLVIFVAGPFVISGSVKRIDQGQHAELLGRAQQAAAPLQGRTSARLQLVGAPNADPGILIREHLKQLRRTDGLLRDASVWKLRGDRKLTLDFSNADKGGWVEQREATVAEAAHSVGLRPFTVRAGERAVVHAPLKSGSLETPVAWLELDYPEAFWSMQRDQARRNGVVLIGVLAGFCATGFVLAGRQAMEGAQRVEIERVQAANRAKTEFLAFLGHELRTPLQTILGRAELIRAHAGTERHADAIETQGRLLLRLVNDLLDLGTIEAGRFELRPQAFSLHRLLSTIAAEMRPVADAAHLSFICTVDANVPDAVVGDETRLRQILANLLGNAVKYTAAGKVSLEVACDSVEANRGAFTIRVHDTGPGLPPEKISQLFTLFTRLDSGETFTREGTGVGLALVRRLCSLMGGTVSAANRPSGGAEFTVRLTLPLAKASEIVASRDVTGAAPSSLPSALGFSAISHADGDPTAIASTREEDGASPGMLRRVRTGSGEKGNRTPARAISILLAEDNTATREMLSEALLVLGHHVVAVADGEAAVAAARVRVFDVAVLDINLPRQDGVAVARSLRASRPNIRLVGCSAEALPAIRASALAAGMDEFLVKPVSLNVLAQTIGSLAGPTPTLGVVPPSAADDVFGRLRSADSSARTRALLVSEWPQLRAAAEASHAAGNPEALRTCAHYLRSSALLLGDEALVAMCGQLAALAIHDGKDRVRETLAELAQHLAKWSAEPELLTPSFSPMAPNAAAARNGSLSRNT